MNESNNSVSIAELSSLQRVLHKIVGLTRTQCAAVASYGYEDFIEFENMKWDSIEKRISVVIKININIGGFSVSDAKDIMIQALALWVNDSLRIGRLKVEADFYETEFITIKMNEMANEVYTHYLDFSTNSDVSTPDKLSLNKWEIFDETVRNWIKTKIGVTNLPLSYVTPKDTNPIIMYHF